jgi:hypothetical protein
VIHPSSKEDAGASIDCVFWPALLAGAGASRGEE